MIHLDDEGFGTVVEVHGRKYWVVMKPKAGVEAGELGDTASAFGYPIGWTHGHSGRDLFDAEGILLTDGDVL